MTTKHHFDNLTVYHEFLGLPTPEHPLFSIITLKSDTTDDEIQCINSDNGDVEFSSDFYSISLKHILAGEIHYGRTKYDFKNGSLICLAPRQTFRTQGIRAKTNAKIILIHEDFLRGTSIQKMIEDANYFTYAVNEALHLSPKEESLLTTIFDTLEQEYNHNHDAFSKDIIISQLNTLLTYAERFYQRQFQQRMEVMQSQTTSFFEQFKLAIKETPVDRIPTVDSIASQLNMTPRYLSDALKVETGKTALENIHSYQIDKAKNLLLGSDDTVATIAHSLGFEYPQYFSRLFKNKVGMTPSQYRNYKFH